MNKNPFAEELYLSRSHPHTPDVRDEYFRDQTKIIHSLPFRRLKHKTQVFFAPDNDHICTRIEHVLHVATIAASICRGLNKSGNWDLNQDLAYAIGLGHDIGHAPFGHEGERAIAACIAPKTFLHEINSYRVVEHLANCGEGLNLTFAVKDGIICHCGEDFATTQLRPAAKPNDLEKITGRNQMPSTYEGCIVRLADKIAYLGRDIEDAIKAKLITKKDIPQAVQRELGTNNGEIISTLSLDLIHHSADKDYIGFSPEKFELLSCLRTFNYEHIYHNAQMRQRKETIDRRIADLFDYLRTLFDRYGFDFPSYDKEGKQTAHTFANYIRSMQRVYTQLSQRDEIIVDYIAGMTDSYALSVMEDVILPNSIKFLG
ncbi:deoxyguanosinetriphosphate triphosphohydrolase family protein [Candidatus Avelusimicrobium aviculae]|uniref:deoxyguanosinetriphosphate triphosphohydrolase family protein n=1 Tax=Candidatus Avelusimicrobium aviculae TaxID=3416206 RepID=UPI003D1431E5